MKKIYTCKICGFKYEDKEKAKECEEFCELYNCCSLEITAHAIKPNKKL